MKYQTVESVITNVAHVMNFERTELTGPSRYRNRVRIRHVAMWLARKVTYASFPEIGRAFHRDHTSCLVAIRKVDALVKSHDPMTCRCVEVCLERLGAA